jgi:Zn-dependent M28 family amino/carboxypeptidase
MAIFSLGKSGRVRTLSGVFAVAVCVGAALVGPAADAAPADGPALARQLVRKVTGEGVNRHLIALQRFADRNGGTRAVYSNGYTETVDYFAGKLRAAGFDVTTPEFTWDRRITEASALTAGSARIVPFPIISGMNTPVGGVRGALLAVPVDANTGCDAGDYAGLNATGTIAVIKRGGCSYAQKQQVAAAQGALAAVVYNDLAGPGRCNLGDPAVAKVPTSCITKDEGAALSAMSGTPATLDLRTHLEPSVGRNLIAQTRTGRKDNVVTAGSQLDAEDNEAGINESGTGSAALLEIALQLGGSPRVNNAVRFTFFGGEWLQAGSKAYLASLDFEAQLDVAMYLNIHMLGSRNAGFFVYDGDNSTGLGGGPFGSTQIEKTFVDYYAETGIAADGTNFDGASNHYVFIGAGIPTGGVYAGAFKYKTAAQAAKWGGTADSAYDPCHQVACDNLGNVDRSVLDRDSDAVAFALGTYATSTEDVNGVPPRAQRSAARHTAALAAKAEPQTS